MKTNLKRGTEEVPKSSEIIQNERLVGAVLEPHLAERALSAVRLHLAVPIHLDKPDDKASESSAFEYSINLLRHMSI